MSVAFDKARQDKGFAISSQTRPCLFLLAVTSFTMGVSYTRIVYVLRNKMSQMSTCLAADK